jgi:hypothetical protein
MSNKFVILETHDVFYNISSVSSSVAFSLFLYRYQNSIQSVARLFVL